MYINRFLEKVGHTDLCKSSETLPNLLINKFQIKTLKLVGVLGMNIFLQKSRPLW